MRKRYTLNRRQQVARPAAVASRACRRLPPPASALRRWELGAGVHDSVSCTAHNRWRPVTLAPTIHTLHSKKLHVTRYTVSEHGRVACMLASTPCAFFIHAVALSRSLSRSGDQFARPASLMISYLDLLGCSTRLGFM